jgi:NADPH:quinone reductase-like Zn-dependent oxidoreductase
MDMTGKTMITPRFSQAEYFIDYTQSDFTKNSETYDVIVDTIGNAPFSRSKVALKEKGRLLLVLAGLPDILQIPWVAMTSSKRVIAGPVAEKVEDLRFLVNLAKTGAFKPIIDRRYPLAQIAEAHRYVDSGRKKGNVVITMEHEHNT